MKHSFDLVVLGTGVAAATVASLCRAGGWSVAIVDSRPFGGTCALRGCDPKKVLVGAADVLDWARRMQGRGIQGPAGINWPELMRFKRTFTEPVPAQREAEFEKEGIRAFHGRARFAGQNTVEVGADSLAARRIVVATGAKPATLKIPGEEHLTLSEQFLELEALPERLVFVGGGYISFEFAHISARAGAQVTILHQDEHPLALFDRDLARLLLERSRRAGIRIELGALVQAVEQTSGGVLVRTSKGAFAADLAVHGAGRVPDLDDLHLAAAGVERAARGVKVNDFLQSVSNPAVYAAGDAAGSGPPLTPTATYEGEIVAANLLRGNHRKPNYTGFASVVYTVPALAATGLLEEDAQQRGLKFHTHYADSSGWYSSRRVNESAAGFKVLIEEPDGTILGAHLLGPHSDEIINLFVLAIRIGLTAAQLKDALYSYPTGSYDIRYMLE